MSANVYDPTRPPQLGAGRAGGAQITGQISNPNGAPPRNTSVIPSYGPASAAALVQDPEAAYRAMLARQGQQYNPRGLFTDFRQSMFGNALVAYINAQTNGGGEKQNLDNIDQLLANFGNSLGGNSFYGDMKGVAANALGGGIDIGMLDPQQADKFVKQLTGLTTMGLSPFAQNAAQNQYKDTQLGIEDTSFANNLLDPDDYGNMVKNSPFWRSLAALAGK